MNLSIVIPVYNVEQYLSECLDSILCQSLEYNKDIEILVINDGSTDNSGHICDLYSEKYSNVITIHKQNGGLASARNAGLSIAKGRYVLFIDSDDKIADESIPNIMNWINKSSTDIGFMKVEKLYSDGVRVDLGENIEREYVFGRNKSEIIKYLASRPKFPGSACGKIYKLSFLRENNLEFPHENIRSEDLAFSFNCILKMNSYDVLNFPYYLYRQNRKGSITNSFKPKDFWDLSKFVSYAVKEAHKCPDFTIDLYSMIAYEYIQLIPGLHKLKGKEKEKARSYLKKYKWLLQYSQNPTVKKIRTCSIFGLDVTSLLLNIYLMKIRKI